MQIDLDNGQVKTFDEMKEEDFLNIKCVEETKVIPLNEWLKLRTTNDKRKH